MRIELDSSLMTNRDAVHDLIAEKLSFPAYYGRNLDALYDLLSAYPGELEIAVSNAADLVANLGSYGTALIKTFYDAAENNPNLRVRVVSEIIENNT